MPIIDTTGIRPIERRQPTEGLDRVRRRDEGGSGFRPQTNVNLKAAIQDIAATLSKIGTEEKTGIQKLPKEIGDVVKNILQQALSVDSTLGKGIGSTIESQRFSMEQLVLFARMLTQMGTLAERGYSMRLSEETQSLMTQFKAALVAQDGGESLEPVLLSKTAFELVDAKTAEQLPQALYEILSQLAQSSIVAQQQQPPPSSESMQFLKQLIKFFMPRQGVDVTNAKQSQQQTQNQGQRQPTSSSFLNSMFRTFGGRAQAQGQPTAQPNQQGQPTTQFNQQGQPTAQFNQQGQPTAQPNQQGQPTAQFNQQGQPTAQFNQQGQPTAQPNQQGQPTSQFNQQGQPIAQFNQQGQPTAQFNQQGQPTAQFNQQGQPTAQFNQQGQPTAQFNQQGQPTAQFNQQGQPTAQFNQQGQPTAQFNQQGQPTAQFNQQGQPTAQFNQQGQPTAQFNQQGQPTAQFNQQGQPTAQFNQQGQPTAQFNQQGQPTAQFNQQGQPTAQFNQQGQPTAQFNQQSQPTAQFNQQGQPTAQFNQQGQPSAQFNQQSQPSAQFNQQSQPTTQFNQQGQPTAQFNQQGQPTAQFNQQGQPTAQFNQQGQPTAQFNQQGQPTAQFNQQSQPTAQFNQQGQPTAQFNQQGQPTAQFNQQGQPSAQFNQQSQPTAQFNQQGQPTTQFNQQGQPTTQFNQQGQPTAQFNQQGQPTAQFNQQGQPTAQFNQQGQPTAQFNQQGQPTAQFNQQGQPTAQFNQQGQPTAQFNQQGQPTQPEQPPEPLSKDFITRQREMRFEMKVAKDSMIRQNLQNTPQTNDAMKGLAQFLLRSSQMTPRDALLLQNFVNNSQQTMNETEARHLQNLLRLCQQNVPLTVQQAAVQQKLPDLPRLWAFMQMCDMANIASRINPKAYKRAGKDISDFANAMRRAMTAENSIVQDKRSFQMMMPLYMGDDKTTYPTYLSIYDEKERDEETGEDKKETWLRICVLTDYIGAAELVFRVYEETKLDMRFYFSRQDVAEEFRSIYLDDLRNSINQTQLNIGEVRVGGGSERMFSF